QRRRGLEIDRHVKAWRLLDRHVGGVCAARNLMPVARRVVEQAHEVVALADQRAGLHVFPGCGDPPNAATAPPLRKGSAVAQKNGACRDDERLSLVHDGECAGIALFRLELDHAWLEPQLARRLGRRIGLFARGRVESDAEYACTWKGLARDF